MKYFILFTFLVELGGVLAQEVNPHFPNEGILGPQYDSFYNPEINYKELEARITDRSPENNVVKIKAESHNVRFLRVGDLVTFGIANQTKRNCKGFIRSVEDRFATIFVPNTKDCMIDEPLLRIGSQISLHSESLQERILYASQYRFILIRRREDLLKQLNSVNNFLWSYDQQVIKTAADFDKAIQELKNRRQRAVDNMIVEKKEKTILQRELIKEIDFLDKNLVFYQIDRQEPMFDRWNMDKDSTISISNRPPKPIPTSEEKLKDHRWYQSEEI